MSLDFRMATNWTGRVVWRGPHQHAGSLRQAACFMRRVTARAETPSALKADPAMKVADGPICSHRKPAIRRRYGDAARKIEQTESAGAQVLGRFVGDASGEEPCVIPMCRPTPQHHS